MMKTRIFKALALLLCLGLWQAGCYPDKFDPEGDEVGPMPTLDFSDPSVEFKAMAENRTVTVTTNYKTYRVEVPEEAVAWCHVMSDGMTLNIAVDDNPFARERSATISVTVGQGSRELTKTVSVFQAGMLPQIKISDSRLNFEQKDAEMREVTVTTNQDEWTYSVLGGDDAWFEVSREGDRLRVKPRGENTGNDTRRGYVNLTSSSASTDVTASGVVVVEQLGTAPGVLLSEDMLSLPAEGGERRIQVVTNQPEWQIHLPSVDWYEARAEGGEMVLTVKRNTGGNARKSELTVASGMGNAFANLSLAQLGTAISLEVSADTLRVDASESYSTLRVTTNADDWEASVVDGSGWCELLEDANSVIVYTRAYDNTVAARECMIRFTAGSLQKEVRVIQLPDMTLTLNHDTLQMAATGETRNVLVITNQTEWSFSMPGEVAAWCSAKANGNTLSVTVNANGEEPRSGEITVSVGKPGLEKRVVLTVTQAGVSDREVLVAFYKATGGEKWMNNTNWCSDKPLSEWYGVTCNEAGRVVGLDMSGDGNKGNNLVGNLASIVSVLQGLTELLDLSFFQNSGISGPIPPEIAQLRKLQKLDFQGLTLTGKLPVELSHLSDLHSLCISSTSFDEQPLPDWLWEMTQLTQIRLVRSNFIGSISSKIGNLKNLVDLWLQGNKLTGNIPVELGELKELKYLLMGYNRLTGCIPKELGELTKLCQLMLLANLLEGSIPVEISKLSSLYDLSLKNNNLAGNIPVELGKMIALQFLSLSGNRFSCVFPEEIRALPNWDSFNAEVNIYPQQGGYGFTFNSGGNVYVDEGFEGDIDIKL